MALAMTGVASADEATATITTGKPVPVHLVDQNNKHHSVSAGEIKIKYGADAEPETAYCIDFAHPLGRDGYVPTDWAASGKKEDLAKIKWILLNSYPTVKAKDVLAAAEASDADQSAEWAHFTLVEQVYAGTQAAIWHFSDGMDLDTNKHSRGKIRKVYDYLVENAADVPEQPHTLTIDPASASAETGEKAGPFTVAVSPAETTTATLTVTGGKAVDKDGNEIASVQTGKEFWLVATGEGEVTVQATAEVTMPAGRVFVHQTEVNKKQKIILAGTLTEELTAEAKATFEESGPSLPVTGSNVITAVAVGLVLLAGGGALIVTMRKRRVRFTA